MQEGLWIARLYISERTATKLAAKHGLDADVVRQAVQCVGGLSYTWDFDDERGWRVIVKTLVGTQECLVVLYQAEDPLGDGYNLGSAYPLR